jgi:hypothetical protein
MALPLLRVEAIGSSSRQFDDDDPTAKTHPVACPLASSRRRAEPYGYA